MDNDKGLTRCAFFQGRVRPGMEAAFRQYVSGTMVPLWSRFPHLRELRVSGQESSDVWEPAYPLVMAMRFDNHDELEQALASPARAESRQASAQLLEMFEGTVFHTVFKNIHID